MEPARRRMLLLLLVLLVVIVTTHLGRATAGNVSRKADRKTEKSTGLVDVEYEETPEEEEDEDVQQLEEEGEYSNVTEPLNIRSRRALAASRLNRQKLMIHLTLVAVTAAFLGAGYMASRYHLRKKVDLGKPVPEETPPPPAPAPTSPPAPGAPAPVETKETEKSLNVYLNLGKKFLPVAAAFALASAAIYKSMAGVSIPTNVAVPEGLFNVSGVQGSKSGATR